MQIRQKWLHPERNVRVGDVVVMVDPGLPRGLWPLGKVIETLPGKYGDVRNVRVKTSTGTYLRPISKLSLVLECEQ